MAVTSPITRHLLIVTDAAVSDAARILRLADEEAVRTDRRRISVLCIDAAPNAFLANELAERGGGVARFLTSDPQQNDIVTALDEVLQEWSEPLLVGLQLGVDAAGVEVSGRNLVHQNTDAVPCAVNHRFGRSRGGAYTMGHRALALYRRFVERIYVRFSLITTASPQRQILATSAKLDKTEPWSQKSIHPDDETYPVAALKALFGARRVNVEYFDECRILTLRSWLHS
ncbi:MAG: hypothetical protein R2867_45920 [Caldilineaceae bacterium]